MGPRNVLILGVHIFLWKGSLSYKKLSCRRETMPCVMEYFAKSLKVIQNDMLE